LERAGIPVAAVLYSLATAEQLRDTLDKLGFWIASILLLVLCAAWTVYVWTAKRPNLLDPEHLQSRYGRGMRLVSVLAIIAAGVPAWFVVAHPSPRVPPLLIKLTNRTATAAELDDYGEAYFSLSASPISDIGGGATRLELAPARRGKSLTVPAHNFIWVRAQFVNEPRRGDVETGGCRRVGARPSAHAISAHVPRRRIPFQEKSDHHDSHRARS
jgi:hypothetical protein